ncbi:hypothetical protein THAOC_28126, partial [Thalassiosira oceanica]
MHSELYNNCHYNSSCVSTAVKSPVYELDAPMVLQSRPKKGETDETTGEPELIAVPSSAVLTGGGSRVLLTYVKTEEHKAVIKLLVENAPGYLFFELIKKYEVLPVYAALLTWFGKAPVTASLNRTSHDGASIVTNDSRSSRADTQSEFAFLLDQGIQNVMQNDERLMEFDPDTNSLGTVLPLGQEFWSGDKLPFKLNTLASDIVEGARAADANLDDATHDGRKRQSFSPFPAMQHEKNWTQTITNILSACDGVARIYDADRGALDSSRLTGEFNLGIVGGTTNDGIDSERYLYLPSGSIMRWTSRPSYYLDRFYHEVPYPTLVSSSSRRLEKDPGVAVVLQDGSRFRFPADEELTTGELRRRISQRTGVMPERMTLSIDGLTLPEGLLQRPLDGPVQVTTTQTGGGGRKPGS